MNDIVRKNEDGSNVLTHPAAPRTRHAFAKLTRRCPVARATLTLCIRPLKKMGRRKTQIENAGKIEIKKEKG